MSKTVVITGSSSGLGMELAKNFRNAGYNIVLNGMNPEKLIKAENVLKASAGNGKVISVQGSVSEEADMEKLASTAVNEFGTIDIWINNAGVNQPAKAIWELTEKEIKGMFSTDLIGAVIGSKTAMKVMERQHSGAIYNVEGYGSNDAMMLGLNIYGTTKRAVTHFTIALAKESEERNTGVIIGRLSPGIMLTEFTKKSMNGDKIELSEKTKNFYNIQGEFPDVVAKHLTDGMLSNKKNNAHIEWLTTARVIKNFITASKTKKDFFRE